MKWFVNKEDKTPLYLQLKDLIKYHISTGTLRHKEQLPTVHGLAKELEVNFETVRKAYKELERQGLVTMERGLGTYVSGGGAALAAKPASAMSGDRPADATELVARGVKELMRMGLTLDEIQGFVGDTIAQATRVAGQPLILCVECNTLQANDIAEVLGKELDVAVRPVLLPDLNRQMAELSKSGVRLEAVVTTGFHIEEVQNLLHGRTVPIDYVIASMSPETRRKLDPYHASARFGFVYRDPESKYYKDILRAELEIPSEIQSCAFDERPQLTKLLASIDVLLATPSIYEKVKELAPPGVPVFNVQDRVDPMSLKMLKSRMGHISG